jgi:hypothetical protein
MEMLRHPEDSWSGGIPPGDDTYRLRVGGEGRLMEGARARNLIHSGGVRRRALARRQVFISYSGKNPDLLAQLAAALRAAGYEPYIAPDDPHPGQPLPPKIMRAIDKSVAFTVILTPESMASPYVQQEIGYAMGRVPVVPLATPDVRSTALLAGKEFVPWSDANLLSIGALIETAIADFKAEKAGALEGQPVCKNGTYELDPGEEKPIPLIVKPGQKIRGLLTEEDGDPFSYGIVDETNLVRYQNGEMRDFVPSKWEEDVKSAQVKWTVPRGRKGPWFLLLSAYHKQVGRRIRVDLRNE